MIRIATLLTATLLSFLVVSISLSQERAAYAPGHVIIRLKTNQSFSKSTSGFLTCGLPRLDSVMLQLRVVDVRPLFGPEHSDQYLRRIFGLDRVYLLRFGNSENIDSTVEQLNALQDIEYAEPDGIGYGGGAIQSDSLVPNDTYFSNQWAFRNQSSLFLVPGLGKRGADIKATTAWSICTGDSDIVVALLDSGLKWDHPDIADRVWVNRREIPGNGIDDDANGFADDIRGWNFAYNNNDIRDDYGHGTNIASIVGATSNNDLGYAGLDWGCKLMVLKELDSTNHGLYSWWASALYYAANNGARVVNMSEGGTTDSPTLKTAIQYAYGRGCLITAAMMNTNTATRFYPAAYDEYVLAVGMTDFDDRRVSLSTTSGSNYGPWLDVVAPGAAICGLSHTSDTDYQRVWYGTSMATAMVSGFASLLLAQDSARDPAMLRDIIRATADDTVGMQSEDTPGYDVYYGYGRINCYRGLAYSPTTAVTAPHAVPLRWNLQQNYPNPFNAATTIRYSVPAGQCILLRVFDVLGREIARLMDKVVPPGEYELVFDASGLASGVYIYRMDTQSFIEARKLILLK
jgi:thermitase